MDTSASPNSRIVEESVALAAPLEDDDFLAAALGD
jgi:hypothetical protein